MAIYPKAKKKIRKYYRGGRYPQGAPDNPFVGVGLQYRETAPEIPNVEAAKYLDASLRDSDAKHEAEYQKRLFDRKLYQDKISKIQATPGAQGKLYSDFSSAVDKYESALRDDIDFVFKPEGLQMAKEIEGVFNPQNIERMKANYADLQTQYEQTLKNGTADQLHLVDGMATVRDDKGNVKRVHTSVLNDAIANGFKPLTNKEHFEAAMNFPEYDISNTDLAYYGSNIKNTDQIIKEWEDRFSGLGHSSNSGPEGGSLNNRSQIAAAKQSIKDTMSEQDKSAMTGLYLETHNNVWNPEDYNRWIDQRLDNIARSKMVDETETKLLETATASPSSTTDSEGSPMPRLITATGFESGPRDNFIGSSQALRVLTTGKSSYSDYNPTYVTLDGANTYKLSDDAFWTTEDNQVMPKPKYGKEPVFGIVDYEVMPEFTGDVFYVKDGVTTAVSDSDVKKGMLVTPEFHGTTVAEGVQEMRDANGNLLYKYVVLDKGDENGMKIAKVNEYGRKVVTELDEEGNKTGSKFITDLSYEDSFRYLEGDYARIKDMSRVGINNGQITKAGQNFIQEHIDNYVLQAIEAQKQLQKTRNPAMAKVYKESSALAKILSSLSHGQIPAVNPDEGITEELIKAAKSAYIDNLQGLMDQKTYKTVAAATVLPKGSFTVNRKSIQGF